MSLLELFLQKYVILFELLGILIMLRISAHVPARTKWLTVIAVLLMLLNVAVFTLERWTQSFEQLSLLRPMLTAGIYSLYPIIVYLLMLVTSTDEMKLSTTKTVLYLLPALACVPIYFTSQWTHLVCWYRPDNHYSGGPLSYLPYIVFGLYCLLFLIRNLIYFRKYSAINRRIIGFIVIFSLVGVLCYLIFEISDDYSEIFAAAILLYYLYMYIHMARIDSLTSLYTRQTYYQDCRTNGDKITGVISVDMNGLKEINDTSGHEAGDRAILAVSEILLDGTPENGMAYRIGGDEFVILYTGKDTSLLDESVAQMKRRLLETPYACAFGVAVRRPQDSVDDVVREADRKMYLEKAEMKSR